LGHFLIKTFLGVLRASAVSSLPDRDIQESHWKIHASLENLDGQQWAVII
jgi:hypothetical protein